MKKVLSKENDLCSESEEEVEAKSEDYESDNVSNNSNSILSESEEDTCCESTGWEEHENCFISDSDENEHSDCLEDDNIKDNNKGSIKLSSIRLSMKKEFTPTVHLHSYPDDADEYEEEDFDPYEDNESVCEHSKCLKDETLVKSSQSKRKFSKLKRRKNIQFKGNKNIPKKNMIDHTTSNLPASLMSHTPCGPDYPGGTKRECWKKGRCSKGFPKPRRNETDATIEGYPHYRRRKFLNQHHKIEMPYKYKFLNGKKMKITGEYLPGYNLPMLMRYRLHENVECSHGMSGMSYLFNYIHKGHDVAFVQISEMEDTKDEIKLHKYGRVMTSDEAHWDLASYKMSEISPTVKRMGYFVPGEKYIRVEKGKVPSLADAERQRNETEYYGFFLRNKLERGIEKEYLEMTRKKEDPRKIVKHINGKLGYDMFFYNNKSKEVERFIDYEKYETEQEKEKRFLENKPPPILPWSFELLYEDFGERYAFCSKTKVWKRYKIIQPKVTRLFLAFPGNDYFYLRILLQKRKGMVDPEELYLGPNGQKYSSYKLACLSWGYIDNSTEYFTAMHEAYITGCYGYRLLKFFGLIIAEGDATNIREIWDGMDPNAEFLTDEEKLYPNGMKHLMITVPKEIREADQCVDYKKLSNERYKKTCEQHTLRQLALFLEKQGKDYPPELPELTEENEHELTREFLFSHQLDSSVAEETYKKNTDSNKLIIIFQFNFIRYEWNQFNQRKKSRSIGYFEGN